MELAVGTIISGKVTAITKFGAFVSLPGGKSGLVHISEVAAAFVSDVHDYLTEGQEVTVKILSVSPEGKINLSIKQAQPQQERPQPARSARPQGGRPGPRSGGRSPRPAQAAVVMQPPAEPSFEDKLKQFMTQSDSKQSELNRYMAGKRGSGRRRRYLKIGRQKREASACLFFWGEFCRCHILHTKTALYDRAALSSMVKAQIITQRNRGGHAA